MKTKMNIKSIIMITVICILSLFFINKCFAINTGKIIVETAKLREKANTESKVLELASIGDEVEILEETEEWFKVKYKNITGYIRSDLIQVENKQNTNNTNTVETNESATPENTNEEINNTVTTENTESQNTNTENTTIETNATAIEDKITKKGIYKIAENVKIKIIPLISSIEIDEINKDDDVEVIDILNDWVKIKTKNEKQGWIIKDKLVVEQENTPETNNEVQKVENTKPTETETKTTTKTMYINSQTVNVREKADKTAKVIKQLSINNQVKVVSTENGWACIEINGTKGYIAENLLSTVKQETSRSATTDRTTTKTDTKTKTDTSTNKSTETKKTTSTTSTTSNTNSTIRNISEKSTSSGSSVISYAKQFLGCKYVYGGTSTNGFDCSGFTQYVYKHFGVTLNRTAAAQYSNGKSVKDLQAGDLIMFGKSGINHVGIYMGGNTFIHAANKSRGVTTDSLSSGYYKKNYVGARRIF